MAFQPVPNTVQCELKYLQDNQEVQNDLYFDRTDAITQANMANLADALFAWWQDYLQVSVHTGVLLKEIKCTPLSSQTAEPYAYTPTGGNFGTLTGDAEPNNVTFCVSFNLAGRGRGFSGRNYTVGVTKGQVGNNTFSVVYANLVTAAYSNLKGPNFTDLGWRWVVVRRQANKVKLPAGIPSPVLNATFTDLTVDSQRRRLPGRGR